MQKQKEKGEEEETEKCVRREEKPFKKILNFLEKLLGKVLKIWKQNY